MSDGDALQVDFAPTFTAPAAAPVPLPSVAPVSVREPLTAAAVAAPAPSQALPADLQSWLDQQEREILVRALRESGFNRTAAANRLGLSLRQIRYRISRLAIVAPGGGDEPQECSDEPA
jgi:two-component system response regulator PilR (NtrC family)